jgi:hypothetical protein
MEGEGLDLAQGSGCYVGTAPSIDSSDSASGHGANHWVCSWGRASSGLASAAATATQQRRRASGGQDAKRNPKRASAARSTYWVGI